MADWRSLLFVPGDQHERMAKAVSRCADAIIIDLEDAVSAPNKAAARIALPESLDLLSSGTAAVAVRINSAWLDVVEDLRVSVTAGVAALIVPKAEDPRRIAVLDEIVAEWELARGLPIGDIGLIPLIESPTGLARIEAIASMERVIGLALGTEDFSLSLGVEPTPDMLELPCRQIALAAASRNLMALAVPLSIAAFRDEAGCRIAATRARAWGSTGALCIHPAQVAIANSVFAATSEEIVLAQAVMDAWTKGDGDRMGVVSLDGKMIDRPIVERAKRRMGSI